MSNPVIFKDLPATFPEEDKHKAPAAISSVVIHIALLTTLILIPLLMPQRIEHWKLLTLIAPLAPPPPPPLAAIQLETPPHPEALKIEPVIKVEPGTVVMPTEIPKEIARVVDDPPVIEAGGVPGGVLKGVVGGVLRNVLLAGDKSAELAPPPPPPLPPPAPPTVARTPIRIGGNIQEPKVVKIVPPVYPKLAIKARVKGTVTLEATVTAEGTVDEVHVMSGNPLLIQAAIDCVKQWRYEPTYLNGEPVPVILTAKINFELGPLS
jgi:protein TonB